LVQTYLGWDGLMRNLAATGHAVGYFITIDVCVFAVMIGLTLLISRRKSQIAKWISIALFVLGLPAVFVIFSGGHLFGSALITIVQTIGQLIAYGLLFTPAARHWLNKKPSAENLTETFS
jgi:hypothetical protein